MSQISGDMIVQETMAEKIWEIGEMTTLFTDIDIPSQ